MDSAADITSKILSNIDIIATIYHIIKTAGLQTLDDKEVKGAMNVERVKQCILPIDVEGVNRSSECTLSGEKRIWYNANDLTVVGGTAINLYDYALHELKERHDLKDLESYIKKKTADIDIVWWPRTDGTDDKVIVSKSEAIVKLYEKFRIQLQTNFDVNRPLLLNHIKKYIPDYADSDTLNIDISGRHTFLAGVFNIGVIFTIKSYALKMCDISIHDEGSSQRVFDKSGKEVIILESMTSDPMYSFSTPGGFKTVQYLNINGTWITVPNMRSLIEQQILAFKNLLKQGQPKSLINYKRIEYLKKILASLKLNNSSNVQVLKDILGSTDILLPNELISYTNEELEDIIKLYKRNIADICATIPSTENDEIVEDLCDSITMIPQQRQIKKLRKESMNTLIKLKNYVFDNYLIKQDYTDKIYKLTSLLIKRINDRIAELETMTIINVDKNTHTIQNGIDDIVSRVQQLDEEAKKWKNYIQEQKRKNEEAKKAEAPPPLPRGFPPQMKIQGEAQAIRTYGYAPNYAPPMDYRLIHVDPKTSRRIAFDMRRGAWLYIDPPSSTPMSYPYLPRPHIKPSPGVSVYRRGGTTRRNNHSARLTLKYRR